ncbi:MAG: ester cyclase [Solirubrobacteraceae bacterium]
MSSDAMTGAADVAASTADVADASRRLLEDSFNTGSFELIDQLVAGEALNHDPALPAQMRDLRGPDALKRVVTMYRAAFPDLRMTVDDVIASGDKVVLRWHSEGTHRGELAGLAPTGVHGSTTGISIDRWQDGKIVEAWAEWDNMGLARQLGAAPPEGSVGEKIGLGVQRLMANRMRRKNPL